MDKAYLDFEQKIGFDKIRQMLVDRCVSPLGEAYVDSMRFVTNYSLIQFLLSSTEELMQILRFEGGFPRLDFEDLHPALKRIGTRGTFLETEELVVFRDSIHSFNEVYFYLKNKEEKIPTLIRLIQGQSPNVHIIRRIEKIVDEKGEIRPDASPEMKRISTELARKETGIIKLVRNELSKSKQDGFSEEKSEMSIRNGRLVIPVISTYKKKLQGFVHDRSVSGKLLYIEPVAALELNNEIQELKMEYKREVIRILTEITNELRVEIPFIKACLKTLGRIDFMKAKALFGIEIDGCKPTLENHPFIEWYEARHPLLYLNFVKKKRTLIAQNIKYEEGKRIIVISGPNAGGKSVSLTMTALLQYMMQCGLMVSALSTSIFGIFQKIMIDIGDEQSLEDDLSTYSSHLKNMRNFINENNENTLFLIDELGSGTEPQLGGSIAEACLLSLEKTGAYGMLTTHYTNLKLLSGKYPSIENAAMKYDTKHMQPLYQLELGKPGSSFAFEIAKKIGLQNEVIDAAMELSGSQILDYEFQVQKLENEQQQLAKEKVEFDLADQLLTGIIERYKKQSVTLENQKAALINEAKEEAKDILKSANRLIEKTIRDIKEKEAEKKETREIRKNFELKREEIIVNISAEKKEHQQKQDDKNRRKMEKLSSPKPKKEFKKEAIKIEKEEFLVLNTPIIKGDFVRVKGQTSVGEVSAIEGKLAKMITGNLSVKIALNKLEKVSRTTARKFERAHEKNYSNVMKTIQEKQALFSYNLDVRGKRGDEALLEVKQYIDSVVILGIGEVRILHGTGGGILRQIIREYLMSVPEVKTATDEEVERGGQGLTVVKMIY